MRKEVTDTWLKSFNALVNEMFSLTQQAEAIRIEQQQGTSAAKMFLLDDLKIAQQCLRRNT